jgi:hypothetical protein
LPRELKTKPSWRAADSEMHCRKALAASPQIFEVSGFGLPRRNHQFASEGGDLAAFRLIT